METIKHKIFGGERPLYGSHGLRLEEVTITAGESALKCCSDIEAEGCEFQGKYPFWHVDGAKIYDCSFTEGARAAIWYSRNLKMKNCRVLAPKMFREVEHLLVSDVHFPDAEETLWHCSDVYLEKVKMENADYLFMHSDNIVIDHYEQHGNYSFQYCRGVMINDAKIFSKDAFWNTRNVTVRNSELHGEYLGWHSEGLRLVNCHISGTQPLCYCKGLVLENCTFDADADLAFEDSDVEATILSHVTSIKNPRSGHIVAKSVGEIINDSQAVHPVEATIEING